MRLPFNYRHFESDLRPHEYMAEGFRQLDRVIDLCGRYGIYVILDMHGAPGYQNPDWHCDNYTGETRLFKEKSCQDRMAGIPLSLQGAAPLSCFQYL